MRSCIQMLTDKSNGSQEGAIFRQPEAKCQAKYFDYRMSDDRFAPEDVSARPLKSNISNQTSAPGLLRLLRHVRMNF